VGGVKNDGKKKKKKNPISVGEKIFSKAKEV
jgi:hypothetical protein